MSRNEFARFTPVSQEVYLSGEFARAMNNIGLGEMHQPEAAVNYADILRRTRIGLRRTRPVKISEGGLGVDGGLATFRIGVPLITSESWDKVEEGTDSYVVSVGGTNFEYHYAVKEDGQIVTKKLGKNSYEKDEQKKVTYDEFVGRIVDAVANKYNNRVIKPKKLHLGVSLGFPHTNMVTPEGIDAILEPVKADGTLPKQWRITDWNGIPEENRSLGKAIKNRFSQHGIDPEKVDIVILNDTTTTALDINTIIQAQTAGLEPLPISGILGTGTNNSAFYRGSLINLESGRSKIPGCAVTTKMIDNISRDNHERILRPELEHEIGGKYIIERLRAGIEILGDRGFIADGYARALADWIKIKHEHNPSLLSDIAKGHTEITDNAIQFLAQQTLRRAGQFFGLTNAAIAEAVCGNRKGMHPAALLAEGSFIHEADEVKKYAENTASKLGQPIKIVEASSIRGAAALSMSIQYLDLAA